MGLYKSSQVAQLLEDLFSSGKNTKMLCSQGELKPAGRGVVGSQKCVDGQGVSPVSH